MSTPYVGEVRLFAGNFAPVGWELCDGRQLPISQYDTLFQLIGTTYGGDGVNTFQLPDLCGRVPIHQGSNGGSAHVMGETGGVEQVTLTQQQIPVHRHDVHASLVPATTGTPDGNAWAATSAPSYATGTPSAPMSTAALASAGGSQPHENRVPSLAVTFIIATVGVFPSQT
jgi:microcystin-dependent protein